jgi:hypothetical protein
MARSRFKDPQAAIQPFVQAICATVGDNEPKDRVAAALDAVKAFKSGKNAYGLPELSKYAGDIIAKRICDWFEYKPSYADVDADGLHEPEVEEAPRPLMRTLPPALPFPVDALGELLGNTVKAISDRAQSPVAICAQSVLAAASLAVMGHADIVLPIQRKVPISLYLVSLAVTGERKSTSDDIAMYPVELYERELRDQYETDSLRFVSEHQAWEIARDELKRQGKNADQAETAKKLETHGLGPVPLVEPTLLADEPTIQGLEKHFSVGMPILGLFATEGGKFINGHSMADDKTKVRAATSLSNLWDGKPIRRMRAESGSNVMPGRRLAMHLQIQPDLASVFLADAELKAQGLLSRLLITYPDSLIGSRKRRKEQASTADYLKVYEVHIVNLLRGDLPFMSGKRNELDPRVIEMDEEAAGLWDGFCDAVEEQLKPGGVFFAVKDLVNKLPEQAARIATVLMLVDTNLRVEKIDAEYMTRGINLAQHYGSEAVRLNEVAATNAELVRAQGLLDWLQEGWSEPVVSLPEIEPMPVS